MFKTKYCPAQTLSSVFCTRSNKQHPNRSGAVFVSKDEGGLVLKQTQSPPRSPAGRRLGLKSVLGRAWLAANLALLTAMPASATGVTIWQKASDVMKDVYNKILGISTVAAVVTAAVALLLMNFSRSGRTVDESRAWLKRIIITWAILNSLGFIMAYITPFFSGGQWTG